MMWIPRVILWALAFAVRLVAMVAGIIFVPFSLAGDGAKRTPSIWRWCANVEAIPPMWSHEDVKWWMYLYPPIVIALAYYSYGNWHELITIAFIFASLGALLVVGKSRYYKFWWCAIRNPLEGLDGMLTQPIPEVRPNPDNLVRGNLAVQKSATRVMAHGVFWEYWRLSQFRDRYFEIRIGWKFVDGNEDFVPTLQFGPKE